MKDLQEKIDRKEFLMKLGFRGASLMAVYGLVGCANEKVNPQTGTVNQNTLTTPGNNNNVNTLTGTNSTVSGIDTNTVTGVNTQTGTNINTNTGINTGTTSGTNTSTVSSPIIYSTDFDLNLLNEIKNVGNYTVKNEIVIARIATSNVASSFIAVSQLCPHAFQKGVYYTGSTFRCSVHGATYDNQGNCTNGITSGKLTVYNTEVNGSLLRIFG